METCPETWNIIALGLLARAAVTQCSGASGLFETSFARSQCPAAAPLKQMPLDQQKPAHAAAAGPQAAHFTPTTRMDKPGHVDIMS